MARRHDPRRVESQRPRHAAEDEAAGDKEDHAARRNARIRRRPAEEQAQHAHGQHVKKLREQEHPGAAAEIEIAPDAQDRHADEERDDETAAVGEQAQYEIPGRPLEQDAIERVREPQARHHADRREHEEHRAEEKEEAERLAVARRILRVEKDALRERQIAREAVIRAADIARRLRVVETDELIERHLDICRLRVVRVVIEHADLRADARIAILFDPLREIEHRHRLVLVEERLGIHRRVEDSRHLHILRGIHARDELPRVSAVVEVDDRYAGLLREISREQHGEEHRHDHGHGQADALIRHALPGKEVLDFIFQRIHVHSPQWSCPAGHRPSARYRCARGTRRDPPAPSRATA